MSEAEGQMKPTFCPTLKTSQAASSSEEKNPLNMDSDSMAFSSIKTPPEVPQERKENVHVFRMIRGPGNVFYHFHPYEKHYPRTQAHESRC